MVAGCGANISKMILFVFNSILWLVAIALIGLAGYVLARSSTYSDFFGGSANTLNVACGVIIAVGCLVFFVAFAGCFGACKESGCLLKIYIAVLLLLVILEVVGGILALVFRNSIKDTATEYWESQLATHKVEYDGKDDAVKPQFVDTIQMLFSCCGGDSYMSWANGTYGTEFQRLPANSNLFVPGSCCKKLGTTDCNIRNDTLGAPYANLKNPELVNLKGCTPEVVNFLQDNFLIIGAAALGLVAAEILAMIFACCVISGINKGEYE